MKSNDYSINFDKILEKLGNNSVLLFSVYGSDVGIIEAERNGDDIRRLYYNPPAEFREAHKVITEVYFILDNKGNVIPTRQSILDDRQKLLLKLLQENTNMFKHKLPSKLISLIAVLSLCMIISAASLLIVGALIPHATTNPFDILESAEVKSIQPIGDYTPGKYRVEINGYSHYFDVTDIHGSQWKCKDGLSLTVTNQIDIWKEGYLLIRATDYAIEKVE